ncbi:histidine phosphatase family protein [Peribacillus sp. NPDC097675]|uniref:histidine phosphatase family protein n=1 Tax=Peribacillus sp. NPDC097675 TaxID=3390618 RepID=UPI003CFE3886
MVDSVAITLLRHGLTEANERKAYLGWTDSPLSMKGKKDIQELKHLYPTYERIHTSDLGRCTETLRQLFPNIFIVKNPSFREMNFGSWEGRTYDELKTNAEYQKWLENPMVAEVPKGESYPEFSRRVQDGWIQLTASEDGHSYALMTHAGVIRELLSCYAPMEKPFWDWSIPHAMGYELIWDNRESLRRGERCTLLQAVPIMGKQNGQSDSMV